MKIVAICSVAVVIGMFAYLVHEAKVFSYLSGDPKVCVNCHAMNTHYATWQHSSHREQASCVDCHLPHDSIVNLLIAKTKDGYNHSLAYTLGGYGNNLRVSTDAAQRIQANCIACHETIVSQMLENSARYQKFDSQVQMGRKCWDCHRQVPHGTTRALTTAQFNLGVKEPLK